MCMHYIYFSLLFISFFVFQACEYESDISVPGYLEIDRIALQHENAIGITDAWVYVNGNIQGVYELPAKFPVIAEGDAKIKVYPGIKVNGISATRTNYPFYKSYETNIKFEPGKSQKISPYSSYDSWVQVNVVDDFERPDLSFIPGTTSDTVLIRTTDSFEGNYAGVVYLNKQDTLFNASTKVTYDVPNLSGNYSGVFLELNFKTDVEVEIGVATNAIDWQSIIYLQPTSYWKKIYIDLYQALSRYKSGDKFFVYLKAQLGTELEEASIYLDDIKIVHEKPFE